MGSDPINLFSAPAREPYADKELEGLGPRLFITFGAVVGIHFLEPLHRGEKSDTEQYEDEDREIGDVFIHLLNSRWLSGKCRRRG